MAVSQKHRAKASQSSLRNKRGEEEEDMNVADNLVRYVSRSWCSNAVGSSTVLLEKVEDREISAYTDPSPSRPPLLHVYSRRSKRSRNSPVKQSLLCSSSFPDVATETKFSEFVISNAPPNKVKRSKIGRRELQKLGVESIAFECLDKMQLRDRSSHAHGGVDTQTYLNKKKHNHLQNPRNILLLSDSTKRWSRLSFNNVDPNAFVGLPCKVFWPLDGVWYRGTVGGYNADIKKHNVEYDDGDKEDFILSNEKIKFLISQEEMVQLKLSFSTDGSESDTYAYNEMVFLASNLDNGEEFELGDIVWAKLTGHAMWPAIVVDDSVLRNRKFFGNKEGERSVYVHFFGTHDFARIKPNHVFSFLKGLFSCFHLKCKRPYFRQSLEEAKMYLQDHKLPFRMLQSQYGMKVGDCSCGDDDNSILGGKFKQNEGVEVILDRHGTSSLKIGDLQIISLGTIVNDSEYFQDGSVIWPEGYIAIRKCNSASDDSEVCGMMKMEVLRDPISKMHPLFRVTLASGEQITGSTLSACWEKICRASRMVKDDSSDGFGANFPAKMIWNSGSDMFGFSNPEVIKLLKGMSNSMLSAKHSFSKLSSTKFKFSSKSHQGLLVGYRPVHVEWKDLDKCSVCHTEEEYDDNLFLQCDKCRIMVHALCYGESEPTDGVLWFCNLCRPGAPEFPPLCCLCPITGGAIKPTSDGRWAHLACAIWIPETCLSNIERMEPIDGLNRVNKDRWKLLCSICGVAYGACIQCSNNGCRVAYHPLCARAAGLCFEHENGDANKGSVLHVDGDDDEHDIRLLSFCKRHGQPPKESIFKSEISSKVADRCSVYSSACNPSGCARCEPYTNLVQRSHKFPEPNGLASMKHMHEKNVPCLIAGCSQQELSCSTPSDGVDIANSFTSFQWLYASRLDVPNHFLSMSDKYEYMRQTVRKRLTFGKSCIHGFGIFAKGPHRAGDMVIEYVGELVRSSIANRREQLIYNSLVGAGTYMFKLDNERVIDATRAGSLAHLINHSCEPNCFSRVISINGKEHIIIIAKRNIDRWEELTYDYRFFSNDVRLCCHCGAPKCRGVVNYIEAE